MKRVAVILSLVPLWTWSAAADTVLDLSGALPAGDEPYVAVPFEVPAGFAELQLEHEGLSANNVLDFGLLDPAGFRCWSGGSAEPDITGSQAASRGCLTGAVAAGTWRAIIGRAWIETAPAPYRLVVTLREAASLPPQPERSPYQEPAPLEVGPRWYAGDFHVHCRESKDAVSTLDEIAGLCSARGLDFVMISDHNTVSVMELLTDAGERHPDLLFVAGEEITTYGGHANAIGLQGWISPLIGIDGTTMESSVADVHAQGALFSINHPTMDLGALCLGCAWEHALAPATVDAVEVASGDVRTLWPVFGEAPLDFWEDLLARGAHAAALGGSDAHTPVTEPEGFTSTIGIPTTLVYAEELSPEGIRTAIRAGRTVVKLTGPDGPMIELRPTPEPDGDTVAAAGATFEATVTGAAGMRLRWVKNGRTLDEVDVDADPFVHAVELVAPAAGEDRLRAEVRAQDGMPLTITSHIWLTAAPPEETSGCGCATRAAPCTPWPLLLAGLVLARRRRARR